MIEVCPENWSLPAAITLSGSDPKGSFRGRIALGSETARHKKASPPTSETDHAPLHNISLVLGRRPKPSLNKWLQKC